MSNRSPINLLTETLKFEEPITWAGAFPRGQEFCFATESGNLWRWNASRRGLSPPLKVIESGEPINGVAFTDDLMVVSTPGEVVIRKLAREGSGEPPEFIFRGGAHGVIASEGGRVLAPMGGAGLLLIQPLPEGRHARTTIKARDQSPYFYRTVQIGKSHQGVEFFASAGRNDGVILTQTGQQQGPGMINILKPREDSRFTGLDSVDLCSLNRPDCPLGLAILGMDGSVHLSGDIMAGSMASLVFPEMKGTPYSVHCAQDMLFLLTSEKLYAMRGVVERLLTGHWSDESWPTRSMDLDAVGCTIVDDEYLLIILEDRITVTMISDLFGPRSGTHPWRDEATGSMRSIASGLTRNRIDTQPIDPTEISSEIMAFA